MLSPASPISASKRNPKKAVTLPLTATLPLATVVACSSSEETVQQLSSSETATSQQAQRPRTVTVGDHDVTVQSQPKRIVALSTGVADLVLELAGPERAATVTRNILDESSGNQIELARQVPNVIANFTKPDPEQILSYELDMVLMTSRHDQEQSIGELLGASDAPAVAFANSDFVSLKVLAEPMTKPGKLFGAEDKATEMVTKIESETEEVLPETDSAIKPKTLALFVRGGQKIITGMQSATTNFAELAGGEPISPESKRLGAVPVDPETIVQLNLDVILIQDFHGQGKAPSQELLDSPVPTDAAAVKNDQVQLIDVKMTSGTVGMYMPDGLREIADALVKWKIGFRVAMWIHEALTSPPHGMHQVLLSSWGRSFSFALNAVSFGYVPDALSSLHGGVADISGGNWFGQWGLHESPTAVIVAVILGSLCAYVIEVLPPQPTGEQEKLWRSRVVGSVLKPEFSAPEPAPKHAHGRGHRGGKAGHVY